MQKRFWLMLLAVVMSLAAVGLDQRLVVRTYLVESDEIAEPIRMVVAADYHGCDYGDGLLPAIEALQPDAVLLPGDIFDDDMPWAPSEALVRDLAARYPCYYVTGNHEYWSGEAEEICRIIEDAGATVLNAGCAELIVNGQHINICGIPDPYSTVGTEEALTRAAADIRQGAFTVLLAHRPELIADYASMNAFDLVVSGHAHGGQVRIPLLVNGLYAPNQGWLPQYAGGLYEVDDTVLVVSRGLARESTRLPRIFNRPELVVIEICPEGK